MLGNKVWDVPKANSQQARQEKTDLVEMDRNSHNPVLWVLHLSSYRARLGCYQNKLTVGLQAKQKHEVNMSKH